jgi:uncharacterized membrane protein YcjF (UPF0283 family)
MSPLEGLLPARLVINQMDLLKNIPFLIFLFLVAVLFTWQWRKTRKLHRQFMELEEKKRNEEEGKLYLDPVRNAYVRSQPKWLIIALIVFVVLIMVLIGLQKTGIIR